MCGIAGFVNRQAAPGRFNPLPRMLNGIVHRGPDESGAWIDEQSGVALGHRRLSILELSAAGSQPMHSADQRYVLVFNGEIYNHLALRAQLAAQGGAPAWRGHSDTETLLACIQAWGLLKALQAAVGMFALALWDKRRHRLSLARDRMGEKPLYWGWQGDVLLFGSELKALKAHPACEARIDRNVLALYLRHGYIAAPHCIYQGLQKLPAGHCLELPIDDGAAARSTSSQPYWSLAAAVQEGCAKPFQGGDAEAADALERQLSLAIRDQMLADVPLGAFLSGGVDSSLIAALMQAQSGAPICTFTMGFDDPRYDEAPYASAVARHLGTRHSTVVVTPGDALDVIPELPRIYDEPFADSSQIPTFLVSRLARQNVSVALSGDAGDELFGGYGAYRLASRTWGRLGRIPYGLRHAAGSMAAALPAALVEPALSVMRELLPAQMARSANGEKLAKFAALLCARDREGFYRQMISHWRRPELLVQGCREPETALTMSARWPVPAGAFEQWLMAVDAQTYLPDDILVKVDRAAMANSLETRIPMLDHRVVELAWRMPLDMKIRHGQGKWLLREVLFRHVPRALIERPKKGFSVPLADWLRGPLAEWAETLLDEGRLRREGYFDPAPIRRAWLRHRDARADCATPLWCVLMFQAWLETQ